MASRTQPADLRCCRPPRQHLHPPVTLQSPPPRPQRRLGRLPPYTARPPEPGRAPGRPTGLALRIASVLRPLKVENENKSMALLASSGTIAFLRAVALYCRPRTRLQNSKTCWREASSCPDSRPTSQLQSSQGHLKLGATHPAGRAHRCIKSRYR